jgi:RND family efflux transporter MFP subunit
MSTRPFLLAANAALVLVLALAGCGDEPESMPDVARPPVPKGTAFVVADTSLPDGFEASGAAEPVQRAALATRLMARVTDVLVHEGERVASGQVLARLDASELDAKRERVAAGLAAAEASWRDAETTARRFRALYADSAAPKAQLDQVEAAAVRAEAGVREARAAGAELESVGDYATLRAPFAGVVVRREIDPGAFAAPGQPLLVVEDHSRLRISVTTPPAAVRDLRPGSRLHGDIAGTPVDAVVEGIVPAPGGHLLTVNALVDNRDGRAVSGGAATLLLPAGMRAVRLVPVDAVVREGDLTGVRVRRAGAWELRWTRLGRARDGMVEILAGLEAGDSVLVPGGSR